MTISTNRILINTSIILFISLCWLTVGTPVQAGEKEAKALYKTYRSIPSKEMDKRRDVLRKLTNEQPDTKTALKAVKVLANLEAKSGPWTDLPAKAAVIQNFLASSKWKPGKTSSLRKDLLKAYTQSGRFDQLAAALSEELNLKPSKSTRRKLTLELGLTLLKLDRRDEAVARLEEAKKLTAKRPRDLAQIDFTLTRLPDLKIKPVDWVALKDQAIKAGQLFNQLKPWKSDQEDQAEGLLIQLARECPLTYHGRQAALRLANRSMRHKKTEQAEEACRAIITNRPLTREARGAVKKLGRIYFKIGQPNKIYSLTENQLAKALTPKELERTVRDMAEEIDGYRPWHDLPTQAAFLKHFLEKTPPETAVKQWRKLLIETYQKMSRYDLVAAELEKDLAAKTGKSGARDVNYKLALNLAKAGRVEQAIGMLEGLQRELAGKRLSINERISFTLSRLKSGQVGPIDEKARTAQEALAAELFKRLISYPAPDQKIADSIIARLAKECPLTYHGRQARYKSADIAGYRNKDRIGYEAMLLQIIRDWPYSAEAAAAAKTLERQFRKTGREAEAAELVGLRLDSELDSTAKKERSKARRIAARWGGGGRWDKAVEWYHRALALTVRLDRQSPELKAILAKTKDMTYLPAPLRLELIAYLLNQGRLGPDTPKAVAEMAGDLTPDDNPEQYIWPDLEFANGLFNILNGSLAVDEKLRKSIKGKIRDIRETLGEWTVLARGEQEKFDQKYQKRNFLYPNDCFKLAVLWQRAGQPDKSKELMERLLKEKRLALKDRKKAELILQRLARLPQAEPMSIEELDKRRDEARQIYIRLVSMDRIKSIVLPGFDLGKQVIEAREQLVERLAKEYPHTFHGNRAARVLVINCPEKDQGSPESDCLITAEEYLHRYPYQPDSRDLWRDLVNTTNQDQQKDAARLLAWAARDWAHVFEEDERELAFKTAEAYYQAQEPAQALPWLKLVLDLDETGESRLAKKADRLAKEILRDHPELAGPPKDDKPLNRDEQIDLARRLFKRAADTPKSRLKDFKEIYSEIIRRCPEAPQAQEAYWRLSNLYLNAYGEPQNKEIIKLLEEFMNRYPDSKGIPNIRRRLIMAYERTGRHCRAADQQRHAVGREEVLMGDPERQLSAMISLYIGNLEKCGRQDAVIQWKKIQAADGSAKEKIAKAKSQGLLDK